MFRRAMANLLMTSARAAGAVLLLLALAGTAPAEEAGPGGDEVRWSGPVRVVEVAADLRLILDDGRIVRLAGLRTPPAWIEPARAALSDVTTKQPVRLGLGEVALDRYGATVAHVQVAGGPWLQGALLEQGLAQVRTRPGETARASAMLALERRARAAGLGLWREPEFRVRAADGSWGERALAGAFQIVRGEVRRVAPVRDYVYLNFGADWRRDFTVRIRRQELEARFARSGTDALALAGHRVEVRGFVLEAGGPLIEVSHPEQIEVLP